MNDIYDGLVITYMYIKNHYIYYTGVLGGLLLDPKPWTKYEMLRYVLLSGIVAHVTEVILKENGTSLHLTILICAVVGLVGHPTLRYAVNEALPLILKTITDKIVAVIKKR